MFDFLKSKEADERLSREFVLYVLAVGRKTCPLIGEAVQEYTEGTACFPVNDDMSLEISLAILGASLAGVKGYSQVMTKNRGIRIETFCKRSIENDFHLSIDLAEKLNEAIDKYQMAFEKSMANESNPFGEISGIMLSRCLGANAKRLCLEGTSILAPILHTIIGDIMTITVTKVLTFWKRKEER